VPAPSKCPDKLLELVEQLPVFDGKLPFVPLTLDEELGVLAAEELLLQLYAFATFGVVIIVGARIIANTLAVEMAIAIKMVTLIIHVIALCDV
jgi:hypothetical protein